MTSNFAYNAEQKSKHSKFAPCSTEHFLYTKTSSVIPLDEENASSRIISDTTTSSCWSNAITRKLIKQEVIDDQMIIITETWITKNPSYKTALNIFLATTTLCIPFLIAYWQQEQVLDLCIAQAMKNEKYKAKIIASMICQTSLSEKDVLNILKEVTSKHLSINDNFYALFKK